MICIEILSLAFFFMQRCIDEKKLRSLAPSADFGADLRGNILNLSHNYEMLRNLHDKILDNYRENLQKYISQLKIPYSGRIY